MIRKFYAEAVGGTPKTIKVYTLPVRKKDDLICNPTIKTIKGFVTSVFPPEAGDELSITLSSEQNFVGGKLFFEVEEVRRIRGVGVAIQGYSKSAGLTFNLVVEERYTN